MNKKLNILILLFVLCIYKTYGQINTQIIDVTINSQDVVNNCGTIDIQNNSSVNLSIYFKLTKPSNQAVGDATVEARLKYSSSTIEGTFKGSVIIQSSSWVNGDTEAYGTIPFPVDESEIDFTGSSIYIKTSDNGSDYSESCEYPFEKDEVPSFSLSPSNTTVSCENTSSKTFTVTPSNIPSGSNVTYQWSVGSGWEDTNGNAFTSLTTTSTSLTLVPNSFPPSNVNVTPILDGDSYPTLTCTVGLGNFNPSVAILGDNIVCDSGIYELTSLPNNVSIQSVSTSDTNIATVSLDANTGEVTVTKVSDGTVTLTVVIQNTCSQTKPLTKQLQIGIPESTFNASISGSSTICSGQNYTYTLSGANHPCVTGIVWSVTDNLTIVSPTNSNSITVEKSLFGSDDFAGEITASIPGTTIEVKKGVLVGTPTNTGLTLQKLGSYEFYTGEWSMLKANYTPLLYESNEPLSITYDWQIPHSQIRSFTDTSRKDVNPNSAGQLTIGVRVQCDCGYGEWAYETFTVTSNGGGTGFEMN